MFRDVRIVAAVPRVERQVPVFGVASVTDRNRSDARRDDPVNHDRGQQNRREPDPAELPADPEGGSQRNRQEETTQPLVEVLLQEEGPVAAKDAPFKPALPPGSLELDCIDLSAMATGGVSRLRFGVLPPPQADGAVVTSTHGTRSYAGNPVEIVR